MLITKSEEIDMKKKTMVSIVASSLLIAPMVLHQVAAADEQTEELAPSTEVVHAPATEARPKTSDASAVTSEEGASLSEASLDRTAGANQVAPSSVELSRQSDPTVPVATPVVTSREAAPQSTPTSSTGNKSGFGKSHRFDPCKWSGY